MKILRNKEKKEKTPEEKELEAYKRGKNIGLAATIAGPAFYGISKLGENYNKLPSKKNSPDKIDTADINFEKAAGIGLGALGLGLHGVSAVKYRKLKKKLEEEEQKNDNKSKKKD